MSRTPISAALRWRGAEAAPFRCGYCLAFQLAIELLLKVDHIVPEARVRLFTDAKRDNRTREPKPTNQHVVQQSAP